MNNSKDVQERADLENTELMRRMWLIHSCFMDAVEENVKALRKLLAALDKNGTAGDEAIRQRHGQKVLDAFVEADKAFQNLECYFEDES